MEDENSRKTFEVQIDELRWQIAIWQRVMSNGRPADAAALREKINNAKQRVSDLEARAAFGRGELT